MGDGDLASELVEQLRRRGAPCLRLRRPTDRELARTLRDVPRFVAIISHDDIYALRLALVAEHAQPGVPLLVTIFDATVAAQVVRTVPNCHVVSLADAAAPVLTADCTASLPTTRAHQRLWSVATSQLRPYDASSRLLVYGVAGLAAILGAETFTNALAFGHPLTASFYDAAKATATVGPDTIADEGPAGYATAIGALMLISTALTAAATAGLINRLTTRRLVALVGRRTLPRRDHVIVVGLGQVGLRLCLMLRQRGVRVIAIERDAAMANVHLAKRLGIPVMIGDGSERGLLTRLRAQRALALASVTSDDHVNIAVSVAALATRPDLRVVLRAGDDDAVTETRALFPIGVVRDVNRLAAARFAEIALGPTPC
ncbi:potassium channel family protein [Baekduia alba]|uniref:potassium channel family protein n=1 Tax=Baekduia alba TaxID=2997333 RepID=UPI002340510C|nr:NAD(P)-binding protein [Baekduia alba]